MDNRMYEDLALRTAPDAHHTEITNNQKHMLLLALGLCGEAGEVAEMIKKHVFHGHPMDADTIQKMIRELGDVLWYITYGAVHVCGGGLHTVMHQNINKLSARYPEGHFSPTRSQNRKPGDD